MPLFVSSFFHSTPLVLILKHLLPPSSCTHLWPPYLLTWLKHCELVRYEYTYWKTREVQQNPRDFWCYLQRLRKWSSCQGTTIDWAATSPPTPTPPQKASRRWPRVGVTDQCQQTASGEGWGLLVEGEATQTNDVDRTAPWNGCRRVLVTQASVQDQGRFRSTIRWVWYLVTINGCCGTGVTTVLSVCSLITTKLIQSGKHCPPPHTHSFLFI